MSDVERYMENMDIYMGQWCGFCDAVADLLKDQRRLEWMANVGVYKSDGFEIAALLLEANWREAIDAAMETSND